MTVTLLPRYTLNNQVAGAAKKYLVEISDYRTKNAGASETELAIQAALSADHGQYGFTPTDIKRDIDHQVTVISPDKKLPDAPYMFEDCRVWPIPS